MAKAGKGAKRWVEQLEVIVDLSTQDDVEAFTQVLEGLKDAPKEDPALLAELLGVLERSHDQDDYGLFGSAECIIDEFPDEVRTEGLRASIRRQVNWKVLELLGDEEEDIAALKHAVDTQNLAGERGVLVREKLAAAGVEVEAPDEASAPAPADPAPREDDFLVVDRGQGLHLNTYSEAAMRAAHRAAPDAMRVRIVNVAALDVAGARRLLECFPPLDLPASHPWYEFATGPCFSPPYGEAFSDKVAAVLDERIERDVSVRRSLKAVAITSDPITPERIAAARRIMPDAARVEFSTDELDDKLLAKLCEAFPRAELAADGAGLTPKRWAKIADRLVEMKVPTALLKDLGALARLRVLKIESEYDDEVVKKALAKMDKLAALGSLEVLELDNGLAPGLTHLTKLPLRRLWISRTADTPIDAKIMEAIAAHETLRELHLFAPVDKAGVAAIAKLPQGLEELSCTEGGDALLLAAGKLRGLRCLSAGGTSVSDAGLEALVGLPLEDLKVEGKKITDRGAAMIGGMKGLRRLNLVGAAISDEAFAKLVAGLPALEHLEVESCKQLGDKALAASLRAPKIGNIYFKKAATVGKGAMEALAEAPACLDYVYVDSKLDEAGFAAVLRYRQGGGRVNLRLAGLSSRQEKAWGD